MSLLDAEQARAQQARRNRQKQQRRKKKKRRILPRWSSLDAPLATSHPNQVLTFHEWCRLNRISVRTGRRIIDRGEGPVVTQLSPQRIGVTVANNAAWQASRALG
jgi:hypothetical protein